MSDPFPAQSSILSADALAAHLLTRYDLPPPLRCRLLQPGDNDTYLVEAGGDTRAPVGASSNATRYALRVYRHGKRTAAEVQTEVDVLALMAQSGVPVAPALPQSDGTHLTELRAPEGPRHAVLFAFAAGALAGFELTPEQSHRYGRAVARLHAVGDAAPQPFPRHHIDEAFLP